MIMIFPLIVLAIGAIFAGYLNMSHDHGLGAFLGQSPSLQNAYSIVQTNAEGYGQPAAEEHGLITPVMIGSACISILRILLAYVFHLRDRALGDRLEN